MLIMPSGALYDKIQISVISITYGSLSTFEMGECWVNQANAIELKNLSKRFGKVVANDKINLTVRYGEILAILGENG